MIKAVRDMVLLKVHHLETMKGGDVIVPDFAGSKQNVMDYYGEVIDIGPECTLEISVGDNLIFQRNEGHKILTTEWEEYVSIQPKRIDGVIHD